MRDATIALLGEVGGAGGKRVARLEVSRMLAGQGPCEGWRAKAVRRAERATPHSSTKLKLRPTPTDAFLSPLPRGHTQPQSSTSSTQPLSSSQQGQGDAARLEL
jgi:hypothetical protein